MVQFCKKEFKSFNRNDESVKTHYSKDLKEALVEAKEMREHPEKYKSYKSLKEFMNDLEK